MVMNMNNNQDETQRTSLIKYRAPRESIDDPYFSLAMRLCQYLKIARMEGYLACFRNKLARDEPSRIVRHIFMDKYGLWDLCNLILQPTRVHEDYKVDNENLEAFLKEQKIRNPKLKEIFRRALPIFAMGESVSVMKKALEPIVGEGLPDDEKIEYNFLSFPEPPKGRISSQADTPIKNSIVKNNHNSFTI
jgi:hypothetical protein